ADGPDRLVRQGRRVGRGCGAGTLGSGQARDPEEQPGHRPGAEGTGDRDRAENPASVHACLLREGITPVSTRSLAGGLDEAVPTRRGAARNPPNGSTVQPDELGPEGVPVGTGLEGGEVVEAA